MSRVYFLYAPSVNLLKIGRSSDPERRFAEIALISPVPIEVIGTVPGYSNTEAEMHHRFDHLRSHGEWFHATKELMEFVWLETLMSLWNSAAPEAREKFLSKIGPAVPGSET